MFTLKATDHYPNNGNKQDVDRVLARGRSETGGDTREILVRYMVQPAPDFKSMNVGLRKRLSFSAIRTKHKPSLDILACVSKQLPYGCRRGNSTQRHLNEITKKKQGRKVKLIFEMKERKPIINSTTEQF